LWPFLPDKNKRLATSFSEMANQDVEASLHLFRLRMYPLSIYHFQQAVEKASKAYGILAGTLQPTSRDLTKQVSHRSLLGIMLRVPEMMERQPAMRRALLKSLNRSKLKEIGAWEVFAPYLQKQEYEDPGAVRKIISQVRTLDAAKLWRLSLELEPSHPFTKLVWQRLDEADRRNAEADDAEAIVSETIRRIMGHPEDIDYVLNLYSRAGPELFPLTLVSMWHERETRYPAIETKDYWNPDDYTPAKGLIKNYKLFHRHTARLCQAMNLAAKAAEKHVGT
jgi:HEPN domain-containing protein